VRHAAQGVRVGFCCAFPQVFGKFAALSLLFQLVCVREQTQGTIFAHGVPPTVAAFLADEILINLKRQDNT
jgi:hypothetical protein